MRGVKQEMINLVVHLISTGHCGSTGVCHGDGAIPDISHLSPTSNGFVEYVRGGEICMNIVGECIISIECFLA